MLSTSAPMLGARLARSPRKSWYCCTGHHPTGDKHLTRRLIKRREDRDVHRAVTGLLADRHLTICP